VVPYRFIVGIQPCPLHDWFWQFQGPGFAVSFQLAYLLALEGGIAALWFAVILPLSIFHAGVVLSPFQGRRIERAW